MNKVILLSSMLLLMTSCTWFQKKSSSLDKIERTAVQLKSLDDALESYKNLIGEYPTDLQELIDGPKDPALEDKWEKPLISKDELVDAWGRRFVYTANPEGTKPPYELYSRGEQK